MMENQFWMNFSGHVFIFWMAVTPPPLQHSSFFAPFHQCLINRRKSCGPAERARISQILTLPFQRLAVFRVRGWAGGCVHSCILLKRGLFHGSNVKSSTGSGLKKDIIIVQEEYLEWKEAVVFLTRLGWQLHQQQPGQRRWEEEEGEENRRREKRKEIRIIRGRGEGQEERKEWKRELECTIHLSVHLFICPSVQLSGHIHVITKTPLWGSSWQTALEEVTNLFIRTRISDYLEAFKEVQEHPDKK